MMEHKINAVIAFASSLEIGEQSGLLSSQAAAACYGL
jgi:hypothetical protein